MKATIKSTALYLMTINGKTSTLEVKNEIHRQKNDPNFVLRQHQVSQAMRELATEECWDATFNGTYIEYTIPAAAIPTAMPAAAIALPHVTNAPKNTIASQITPTIPGKLNPLQVTYSSKDASHPYVGYISGNPDFYATGVDKNDVRRKIFLVATSGYNLDITYDDINFCTADFFFKKYH